MGAEILDIALDDGRILVGFSTKFGGVSEGEFSSLNLGDHVGDSYEAVMQNRRILAGLIGVSEDKLKFMDQIHSNKVHIIRNLDDEIPPCDGLITNLKGVAICVMVADCSPILLVDKRCGVVAALHAGRAGVTGKICTEALNLMKREFGCKASDITAITGANIKGGCYEVGKLDLGEFNRYKFEGKFDMNAALADEFDELGITDVKFSQICTHCDERYFSYRRDGVTGRFAGFAMMRE